VTDSLADPATLARLLADFVPDLVLHLAADPRRGVGQALAQEVFQNNLAPVQTLLAALGTLPEARRPGLLLPGSQMEYGDAPGPWTEGQQGRPQDAYARGKLAATEALLAAVAEGRIRGSVLRLPLVFGPGQPPVMFIPQLLLAALAGQPFPMSSGVQRRRFVLASDVALLMLELGARLHAGEALPSLLNCPASPPVAVGEVAERLLAALPGAQPGLLQRGLVSGPGTEDGPMWPDSSMAESLGLRAPTELQTGLALTARWYLENPWFREPPGPPS
jgi:nucleoside-diphosphate-sugar epimerase